MRSFRFLSIAGAVCAVVALTACGGGSTSSGGVAPIPSVAPTQSAAPDPFPTASGDTFVYSGTLTQTFTAYGTPPPTTPAPTATPWVSTTTQTVTQNVSISGGASFAGQSGLTDLTTKETDAGTLSTTTLTSNDYVTFVSDPTRLSGTDVDEVGTTTVESSGVQLQTTMGSGNGLLAELPQAANAQWTNTAARNDAENDPSGETQTITYAGDGSYQESLSFTEGGNATAQEYSDGSGFYVVPVNGFTGANSTITVNAPANSPTGEYIQISYSIYGAGYPQAGLFQIPSWFQMPPALASDSFVDTGSAAVPAACNVPATLAAAGSIVEIQETRTRLDAIFGELETYQSASYISSTFGVLCVVANDNLQYYYDFSGQTAALFNFSSTPLEETALTETLGLQSAQLAAANATARVRRPSLANLHAIVLRARAAEARKLEQHIISRKPL